MARAALPQNYLKNTLTPIVTTDQATLTAAAKSGIGAGGSAAVVSGGGPQGQDSWRITLNGASSQYRLTSTISKRIDATIGFWVKFEDANVTSVAIFATSDGFVNYFAHTYVLTSLEQSGGWFFVSRPLSQFANQGGGSESWANTMTSFRITAISGAGGGGTIQVCDAYETIRNRPKCIFYFDDSNDTDLTEAKAYLDTYGFVGVSCAIESKIGTTNFLTEANLATLAAGGWDIIGHHETFLNTLTLQQQIDLLTGVRGYLEGLGYIDTAKYFAYPGGVTDSNTYAAMVAAGMKLGRTVIGFADSSGIAIQPYQLHALGTSVDSGATANSLLTKADDAIANSSSFATFTHGIYAGATGGHTTTAVFQAYVDGIAERVNKGLCDVVTLSEWYNGLTNPRRPA